MKANLLKKFDFGNEAGDDVDLEELTSYFVEQESFNSYLDKRKKFLVATAKKGVGKSALIQWNYYKINKTSPADIVIKCRGADLTRDSFGLISKIETPNEYIRDWMIRICALINRELAKRIGFAITDDKITLVESAELNGYKSRNIVGCLIDRFEKILGTGTSTKQSIKDEIEILKRAKDINVWILIDDLDATFQNSKQECLSMSTFFSACRYIIQDIKGVRLRVSMRSDVWPVIRRFDESLDKMEQYVNEITWEIEDFRRLLYLRVKSQCEGSDAIFPIRYKQEQDDEFEERVIALIFVPKMPWGEKEVFTYKIIYTLSYHRPRWAIQLCKIAQKNAVKSNSKQIRKGDIDAVWGEYGKKRISDLVSEHKHQCREVEELITAFRGADRLLTREELMSWVNSHIVSHLNTYIEGNLVNSPLEIAHFLYRIGFIVARSDDGDGGYEHYHFHEMPDFLSARTNQDFNLKWEIHPCYRQALDIKKLDKFQRIKRGLHK
ncbi:MAG: hypothetical protein WC001_10405 [Desulfurivibrionaceae bacterium]